MTMMEDTAVAPDTAAASGAPASDNVDGRFDVVLRNVSKDYRRGKIVVPVLNRLSLDVRAGEFVALMGASGSGKTTLLNLIGGLNKPSAGSIQVAGEAIDRLSRARLAQWRSRHIGFIFQFYNLLPALTAAQNVELPLLIQPVSPRERAQRVANALQVVGLEERRQHKPSELSGGQQQRVAIARALIADPQILLCDEPTGDLDRENGAHIMDILQMLNSERGKTIILATHDPEVAGRADRTLHVEKSGKR
jgi:putative ABC transport system ATP-binding protein